ncbi:hypothetical protein J3T65_05970 [Staphylococcus simiae]|uniref:immunodominant staphylococcal antigen IsaB family protein n=1 Tax=Staphylococcus simiae TaxID=308354 RepID=UPI001A971DBF|nr:hypothetical protein [Staphylococcus simiae]MBO1199013.1 hypothetical protein [Staphylococcus simiae]MBO1201281.1 hypothetical protein [Staphylococcus simiae]MBO1203475.1 hypothetical protein [Staphylococcus simiae]MBO1211003.1 hypothetical protein [Staphylococcus simiae]MBO1229619.1 hypothetical protein [Staphylococcus simiae]
MKKTTKVLLATTMSLSTLLGASISTVPVQQEAHAATVPHYSYHGYIGKDASFLTDKYFVNAIKHQNVKFNDVKLAKTNSKTSIEKYDQKFNGITSDGQKANQLQFVVKDDVSLSGLQKAYGQQLKSKTPQSADKQSGIFYYQPKKNQLGIWFVVNHNKVVEVAMGYAPYTTSK